MLCQLSYGYVKIPRIFICRMLLSLDINPGKLLRNSDLYQTLRRCIGNISSCALLFACSTSANLNETWIEISLLLKDNSIDYYLFVEFICSNVRRENGVMSIDILNYCFHTRTSISKDSWRLNGETSDYLRIFQRTRRNDLILRLTFSKENNLLTRKYSKREDKEVLQSLKSPCYPRQH